MVLACYFNSLMQILYTLPPFVQAILTADVRYEESKEKAKPDEGIDPQIVKRIRASQKLILETKKLFAIMSLSDKKYTDPSAVLHSIVDDFGNPIQIGEQKDIGEFNNNFLARIQEGLNAEALLAKLRDDSDRIKKLSQSSSVSKSEEHKQGDDVEMLNQSALDSVHSKEEDVSMIDTTLQVKRVASNMPQLAHTKSQAQRIEEEGGVIAETFFGKLKSFIQYRLTGEQEEKFVEVQDSFVEVMLSALNTKNMYEAWDSSVQCQIEDYQTPEVILNASLNIIIG